MIAGLLCLLFSDLGSNRSLGPVTAIGVAFAVLASLTLLPSLTYLLGRASYWPRMPRFDSSRTDEEQTHTGVYARTGPDQPFHRTCPFRSGTTQKLFLFPPVYSLTLPASVRILLVSALKPTRSHTFRHRSQKG